jgi:hypothetical protein
VGVPTDLGRLVVPALVIMACVGVELWAHARAQRLVTDWAVSEGYQLVSCKRRWVDKGPFTWPARASWIVFAVVVASPNGRSRAGWIRVGGYWIGLLSSRLTVSWQDDELAASVAV